MGHINDSKEKFEKALKMREKLLKKDPFNVSYQLDIAMIINNLGALLAIMGHFKEAKQRYEKELKIYEKLLENDPENVTYRSYVGTTLNNIGNLLRDMGHLKVVHFYPGDVLKHLNVSRSLNCSTT